MSPERWRQIDELFQRSADLSPAERSVLLAQACGDDGELRRAVEAMLSNDGDDVWLDNAIGDEARALHREDAAGRRIGPYRIGAPIGHGGMGAVYRATREGEFQQQVAIKLLRDEFASDALLERFRQERQILASLEHPNIARLLYGGATAEGLPFIAMEFVEGLPLIEACREMPVRRKLALFRKICSAVQYAHARLVVHRDIKPTNILVTGEGEPKLLDFGIAKMLDPMQAAARTSTGYHLMTPDYASPEQVRGEAVTTATDIYSLGAVLYELLSGVKPHKLTSYDPAEIARVVCETEVERGLIPGDLDTIVLKAMHKDAGRRYESVEQFSADILRYLEDRPVAARPDSVAYRWGKFLRRNRYVVAAGVFAVVSLGGGLGAALWQAHIAEQRFTQVRRLVNRLLFDIHDRIAPLAGSTETRQVLVTTALEYLDNLSQTAASDHGLALELATAYIRVGDVQGNPWSANLGQPDKAMESYRKSLAIAETQAGRGRPDAGTLRVLAEARLKIGQMHYIRGDMARGAASIQAGIEVAELLGKEFGEAWRLHSDLYHYLAKCLSEDEAASLKAIRRAAEIGREWVRESPGRESQYWLSVREGDLAVVLQNTGQLTEARDLLMRMRGKLADLDRANPADKTYQRDLGVLYGRLARLIGNPSELNMGRPLEALEWVRKMLAVDEATLAADPHDARAREDVGTSLAETAIVESELDKVAGTRSAQRALTLMPGMPGVFVVRALLLARVAMLRTNGQAAELESALDAPWSRLPASRQRRLRAFSYLELARAAVSAERAERMLDKAMAETETGWEQTFQLRAIRADVIEARAALRMRQGRRAEGCRLLAESRGMWEKFRDREYGAMRWAKLNGECGGR